MNEFEHIFANEDSAKLSVLYSDLMTHFPGLAKALAGVATEAKEGVRLTFTALQFRQTDQQRKYYHMWKNAFADFCGTTPDEMHEHLLCETYGSEMHNTRLGLMKRPIKRSSQANRTEYSVLIETLIRVASEMGFNVPPPVTRRTEDE